jgi:hypothetical protein
MGPYGQIIRSIPMAKGSVFRGAVPYSEALARLDASFAPKPGDLLTHAEMARVIQSPADSSRYRGVLTAWMKRMYRTRGLKFSGEGRARGVGVMVCTAHEHFDLSASHLRQQTRRIGKEARELDGIDTRDFSADEISRHNLARRYAHEAAAIGRVKLKEIAPPLPTREGNVRVFKK